jgi:hypothetical protein
LQPVLVSNCAGCHGIAIPRCHDRVLAAKLLEAEAREGGHYALFARAAEVMAAVAGR